MTDAISILESAFRWLLDASISAGLLAVATGFFLWILRDRVSARWKHAAWMLVVARLCLPWVPSSPMSLDSLLRWPQDEARPSTATVVTFSLGKRGDSAPQSAPPEKRVSTPLPSFSPVAEAFRWTTWLAFLWFSGFILASSRLAFAAWRERRRLRGLAAVNDARLAEALAECAISLRLRGHPPLLFCGPGVTVPSIAGMLRPCLLVPEDRLASCSKEELRHVFLHELGHLKRRDVALNWLLSLLEAVHWFNPAVRWAFLRAREERELACDEVVLAHTSERDGRAYASTLVRLIESSSFRVSPVAALGLDGKRFIERRLRWIASAGKRKCSPVLSGLLLACCAAAGLTCTTKEGLQSRLEVRSYDVEALLETARDFSAPHLGIRTQEPAEAPSKPEDPEEVRQKKNRSLEELAALVRSQVSPETWERESRMDLEEGRLKVSAPEKVHEGVKAFLDRRLAQKGLAVCIQYKLLALDEASLRTLSKGVTQDVDALLRNEKLGSRRLSAAELNELEGAARLESGPTLTTFDRQRCHILVASQASLIADVKRTEVDGKPAWEPVLGILDTGFTVQSRPEISDDRKRVALDLEYEWADVRKPIESRVVEGIPVAVPEMSMVNSRALIDAPFGEWMLASAFVAKIPKEETRLFLVKAEMVKPGDGGRSGEGK